MRDWRAEGRAAGELLADALNRALSDAKAEAELVNRWLVGAGLVAAPPPTDPRERALYLRKNRNTGPGKPVQEQRRKR